ncbi:MAG: class I SAM-dependent methyltransferase [Gaiellaceae bacterium]
MWALDNWERVTGEHGPNRALDVGCGTGRNTLYLAQRGIRVTAFDSSPAAVEAARRRLGVEVRVHDLRAGLPAGDGEIDLIVDTFVYKHQVLPDERRAYRREMLRVLAPGGVVLISLAEPDDGYYAACPPFPDPEAGPNAVLDPELNVGSVLLSLEGLAAEASSDGLTLVMAWRKQNTGWMHGRRYPRRTLVTLWKR